MVNVLCTDILIELMRKLWDACGTYCQPYENLYTGDWQMDTSGNFFGIICPDDGKQNLVSLGNIQGIFQ